MNVKNVRFFTLKEIKNWLPKCGYEVIEIKHTLPDLFDLNSAPDNMNIDLDRFTIKNVSKEEAKEFFDCSIYCKSKKK